MSERHLHVDIVTEMASAVSQHQPHLPHLSLHRRKNPTTTSLCAIYWITHTIIASLSPEHIQYIHIQHRNSCFNLSILCYTTVPSFLLFGQLFSPSVISLSQGASHPIIGIIGTRFMMDALPGASHQFLQAWDRIQLYLGIFGQGP